MPSRLLPVTIVASFLTRDNLAELDGRSFDAAVIGGGINGSAVVKTLAAAGYNVLLVERNDFGSESTSRSSRMFHCGLNYLAIAKDARTLGEKLSNVLLARNMMRERERLSQELPGRLKPVTLHIPLREADAVKPWQFDFAFAMLKGMGGYSVPLNYRRTSKQSLISHPLAPYLGNDLVGIASYSELVFDWPERVCVEYALEAAGYGATVLNYVTLTGAEACEGGWRLTLVDSLTGKSRPQVIARVVVNMAGPWSNGVNRLADADAGPTVTPNKGCHFAVRLPPAFRDVGIVSRNTIGHMFICLPWKDFHIIGPSETAIDGASDQVEAGDEDIDRLLREAGAVIPGASITRKDVLFRWAGMRPATFEPGNPLGGWKRRIYVDQRKGRSLWLSMSWGRLADHAITSRDVLACVADRLGVPSRATVKAGTPGASIPKGVDLDHIVRCEAPASVADVMFGRTGWGWAIDLGLSTLPDVAAALARHYPSKDANAFSAEYEHYLSRAFGRAWTNAKMEQTLTEKDLL